MSATAIPSSAPRVISQAASYGGVVIKYEHESTSTGCTMRLNVFLPHHQDEDLSARWPSLYCLAGLTCTEDNFMMKSGAIQYAAKHGIALICPDTSPRGLQLPGESDVWSLGESAGFYVDAVKEPWSEGYRMYSYVTDELPKLLEAHLPLKPNCRSVTGHSMGGHGALICFLKNPSAYRSVSAFAPISHPSASPWGIDAFSAYLGDDKTLWAQYDATELVSKLQTKACILIDEGLDDPWAHKGQLLLSDFEAAATRAGVDTNIRRHPRYEHGYYFISTFIADHIAYHAKFLHD
uniref:S-formylglutathione hydrolase n=1 Tax=Spongospora subterranea TaxID=70186 RepID=A0A0H5QJD6_9EUKA|eukprot:CRZ01416.1 hypothetical protein [Spongospora subterranea]